MLKDLHRTINANKVPLFLRENSALVKPQNNNVPNIHPAKFGLIKVELYVA